MGASGNSRHAVVLGASMAGLGAARALTRHYERVTVVERDTLPAGGGGRKGVPQGGHAHGLLASGFRILDAYFPGMMGQLVDAGALELDLTGDFLWYQYGGWKLRADCGLEGIVVSRPLLESTVRGRVRALAGVAWLENHDVEEPVLDDAGRVNRVLVKDRTTGQVRAIEADLVVDALGRGSPSPRWLKSWGFDAVSETNVRVDVGYATGAFERRPGDLHGARGAIIAGTAPESKRYAAVLAAEGDRWVVTLVGTLGDHPPTEVAAWRAFAATLPTPDIHAMVEGREPLAPIASYRFNANRRRHFERLGRFPGGFLVVGDAMCSFNPLYGQGMSVALREARALDDCLEKGDGDDLAARFFAEASAIIESPWAIATGEDLRYPEVEGARPPGFGLISRYMARAHRAATRDPVVLRRFFEVASLLAPPTAMLSPGIAWRVLVGGVGAPQPSPERKVAAAQG